MKKVIPVWLASPDQVSQLFSLDDKFDCVIFDEASQISLENAIPAIARAKRVVVVGDKMQMPPSHFFQSISDDEDEELDIMESLLSSADDIWPDEMLRYHYRSRYPELIEFSNKAFYDGRLNIAPTNNVKYQNNNCPIQWHQVDGIWNNKKNEEEAESIVTFLLDKLEKEDYKVDNEKTLWGIVTFNISQAQVILDILKIRLDEKRREEELTQPENIIWEWCVGSRKNNPYVWVKNLENVQGDEIQHLIISVGYSKDPATDRVPNHFGPLTHKGGEKRLNVAVTRAKGSIDVFCSFDPDRDLVVKGSKNIGPKLFKAYLQYTKAISNGDIERARSILDGISKSSTILNQTTNYVDDFDSIFEVEVAEALRKRGYNIRTQVGSYGYSIDLGVVHPDKNDRFILGIECDGATYHSSISARERDVYRQLFLESRGWNIERIWSRTWWENPKKVLEKIDERIKKLLKEEKESEVEVDGENNFNIIDYLMEDLSYDEKYKVLTKRLIKLLSNKSTPLTSRQIQQKLNYTDSQAIRKAMQPLKEQGLIISEGRGSGTKYKLKKVLLIDEMKKVANR